MIQISYFLLLLQLPIGKVSISFSSCHNFLTQEESQRKDEIVGLTEQVLDANGLECDERISKLSEEKLREILDEVRKLRNRRKRSINDDDSSSKEELRYAR